MKLLPLAFGARCVSLAFQLSCQALILPFGELLFHLRLPDFLTCLGVFLFSSTSVALHLFVDSECSPSKNGLPLCLLFESHVPLCFGFLCTLQAVAFAAAATSTNAALGTVDTSLSGPPFLFFLLLKCMFGSSCLRTPLNRLLLCGSLQFSRRFRLDFCPSFSDSHLRSVFLGRPQLLGSLVAALDGGTSANTCFVRPLFAAHLLQRPLS